MRFLGQGPPTVKGFVAGDSGGAGLVGVKATDMRPHWPISVWEGGKVLCDSCRSSKDVRDLTLERRRENHASQEACSGGGLGFLDYPFEVLFYGVFAQRLNPVAISFIGKSEHEINHGHLLASG